MDLLQRVLYRDGLMLVIDKPTGWAVHGPTQRSKNLEILYDSLRFGLPRSPSLAHRLDQGTSGCLVLGRHPKALRRLQHLFAQHKVEKKYWALVQGRPVEEEGCVDQPLLKVVSPDPGVTMAVHPEGQPAVTYYRLLGQIEDVSWLELRPVTGRTHQLRLHCRFLGCPIIGDHRYGTNPSGQLCLHARQVIVPLYPKRLPIMAIAPPPSHMKKWLDFVPTDTGDREP
ncbi:MAG: RNA pseudouridine synthase [Magnetococcales bacterium]|nr:RNA pseudouridine synthase [Magnetococcales bacterium]